MLTIGLRCAATVDRRDRAGRARALRRGAAGLRACAHACRLSPSELRGRMVEQQLRGRDVVDERVLAAMERVPRELFVPERLQRRAYEDAALPIGDGQTISQPYMVARIAEALALHGGRARPRRRHRLGLSGGGARRARRRGGHDRTHPRACRAGAGEPDGGRLRARAGSRRRRRRRASPRAHRSARSRWPPPRRSCLRRSTSNSSFAAGWSFPSAAVECRSCRWSCAAPKARPSCAPCRVVSSRSWARRASEGRVCSRVVRARWRRNEGVSGAELLALPVRLHGIQLGRPVDLLLDRDTLRAVGLDVLCGDEVHRFLPLPTASVSDDEIAILSPLVLLEEDELHFYRSKTFALSALRGRPCSARAGTSARSGTSSSALR